jgi:ABC-type lipoprotein release transport system permease subunit
MIYVTFTRQYMCIISSILIYVKASISNVLMWNMVEPRKDIATLVWNMAKA